MNQHVRIITKGTEHSDQKPSGEEYLNTNIFGS